MAAFTLPRWNEVVVTDTIWPTKLKQVLSVLHTAKGAHLGLASVPGYTSDHQNLRGMTQA